MSSKRVCPNCGRKMKQQFIGLFHCKCGLSWKRDIGFLNELQIWCLHWKEYRQAKGKTGSCYQIQIAD